MPRFYHFIYTRRDSTGWGLIHADSTGMELHALEELCRSLPVPGDTPNYALAYSAALQGFVLCSCVRCESGSDHRGRMIVDAALAADPADRCNLAAAVLPAAFAQEWNPAWDCDLPETPQTEERTADDPLTPDALHRLLEQLGVSDAQLPALLFFIYRALPRQSGVFPLRIPEKCPPLDALRAFARLLACTVPPSLHKNCTIFTGSDGTLRFQLSPAASEQLPDLPAGDVQTAFYQDACAALCANPAGYLDFLRRAVLDVLPEEPIGWQAYPYFYLLTRFEAADETFFADDAVRARYLQSAAPLIAFQTEYPALADRLRALLTALALACTDAEADAQQKLLTVLLERGGAASLAQLPSPLRTDAARLLLRQAFTAPDAPISEVLAEYDAALAELSEEERRVLWEHRTVPRLAGCTLEEFAQALSLFALPDADARLTERLDHHLQQLFVSGWVYRHDAHRQLLACDSFARANDLTEHFERALLTQFEREFACTLHRDQLYVRILELVQDLPVHTTCTERFARYASPKDPFAPSAFVKPSSPPGKAYIPQVPPASPPPPAAAPVVSAPVGDPLLLWADQYGRLLNDLTKLIGSRASLPREQAQLPAPYLNERFLQEAVQEAGRRLGLSKKQIGNLLGKHRFF